MHFVPSPNAGIAQWNFTNGLLVLKTRKALLSVIRLLCLRCSPADAPRCKIRRGADWNGNDVQHPRPWIEQNHTKRSGSKRQNGIVFKKHRLASEAQNRVFGFTPGRARSSWKCDAFNAKKWCAMDYHGLPWHQGKSHATTRNQYIKSYHCNFGVQFLRRVYSGRSLNGAAHPGLILLWLMDAQPPKTSQNNSPKSSTISRWMLLWQQSMRHYLWAAKAQCQRCKQKLIIDLIFTEYSVIYTVCHRISCIYVYMYTLDHSCISCIVSIPPKWLQGSTALDPQQTSTDHPKQCPFITMFKVEGTSSE